MVRIVVEGECLACGDCCRLMCKHNDIMCYNENTPCKYLDDNLCLIHLLPEDRRAAMIPADALEYFNKNCRGFPAYLEKQNPEMLLPALQRMGWPTKNCGYTVVVYDG